MKLIITRETVVYHKKNNSIGILFESNLPVGGRRFHIEWADCLMKCTVAPNKDVTPQDVFDGVYETLGEL